MREAADMHQNPDYYGLAEIRFYTKERADVRTLAPVRSCRSRLRRAI